MGESELVADLKASLGDAGKVFTAPADADYVRFLAVALEAMQAKRPRTLLGQVTITADEPRVPIAPADFVAYKTHVWGGRAPRPWDPNYPGALPRVTAVNEGNAWALMFDPPPTSRHVAVYGSTFRYWYFGAHRLGVGNDDAGTTIAPADRALLVLRAQAEAMRELAMRNVNKPVTLRDGFSGTPRNSTPSALFQALLKEWEDAR